MSIFVIKEKLEERQKAFEALNHLTAKIKEEKRVYTADEKKQDQDLKDLIVKCNEEIETENRMAESAKMKEQGEYRVNLSGGNPRFPDTLITPQDRDYALRGWLLGQAEQRNLTNGRTMQRREYTDAMQKCGLDAHGDYKFNLRYTPFWYPRELRTGQTEGGFYPNGWNQGGSTGAGGGFLTEQSHLIRKLEVFTIYHAGMMQASQVIATDDGSLAWLPQFDVGGDAKASVHTENSQMDESDATFGHAALPVFVFDSFVLATLELLQDAKLPLEEILSAEVLSVRIARRLNTDFTTGNGTGTATGIQTAIANSGTTYTSASSGTFTYSDLVQWLYTLDYSYLIDPSMAIMLSQTGYRNFLGLVDNNNRPLMDMNTQDIEPRDRLLGFPVIVNNDFGSFAANNTIGVAGKWSSSYVRTVGGLNIRVLNERFIYDQLAIGIAAWQRAGYLCGNPKAFVLAKVHV
jgi:HK97 family phage major capsid protein